MNLSAPFIQRPVMTTLAMVAILFTGLLCYYFLPISSMPNVNFPTINVKATFPGALPETMASSVALPMEKQFMAIPGLRIVSSNNTLGSTSIVLQFDVDKDMLTAAQDVQEAISTAIPYLPPTMPYGPVYRKVNPASQPVIILGLTSPTAPRYDLYTYANTIIGQRISMLHGVSQVTTYGSILAVRIQTDPDKLVNHDITLAEVSDAVQLENVFLPTGQLDGTQEAPIISVDGEVIKAEDYNKMIVAYRNGTPVKIEDIGNAITNFQNNKLLGQYVDEHGAQPTVVLAVQKDPSANTVEIADGIYKLLEELKVELPPAIDVHVVFDHSVPVRGAIHDAIFTLLLALVFIVFVIYIFLGRIADTIIPSLVLPMSVIGTFIVMYMLGFTLDNLSVLALTLAMGFIVDDAVVVLENIIRRVEIGETPVAAAMEGSREIGFTIVSMSLSLLAVFIPMLFMGGLIGKMFSEFAVTLAAITLISGVISLTLTPMLCGRFIPPREQRNTDMPAVERFSKKMNSSLANIYHKMLVKVFDYKFITLSIGLACLVATFFLFYYLPTDFVPNDDVGFFAVYTQEREGGSSEKMLSYENDIIKVLKDNPAVDDFVALSAYSEYRKGLNYVHLKPEDQRKPIMEVIQEVYAKLKDIIGIQAFIKNIPLIDLAIGQEARSAYQYSLQGIHNDAVYRSAKKMLAKMQADPLFQGVNSDMEVDTPQVNVSILRDQAAQYGLSATDIENVFDLSYSGNLISLIQTPIDQYNVILELAPQYQRSPDTLNKIWLRSSMNSNLVPLSSVATWKEELGATSVNHINQFPAVTISFNLAPNVPLQTALEKLDVFKADSLEGGVNGKAIGAAQTFNESIKSSGFLLLLTVFSIYIILGILYESFIHPITILATLPPATFGGLIVLLVFGLPLSMYSFLGIILLIGIVKKNGIMIVDFAIENMRLRNMESKEAIIDACMVRFRPIMMTTVAAIFGVLPIALGYGSNAAAKRPLGLVIIGGLCISQMITLFVTPVLYLEFEKLSEHFNKKAA